MSGKQHKKLRRLAEDATPVAYPDRDIVAHPRADTTALNSPQSLRGVTQALKRAFNNRRRGA